MTTNHCGTCSMCCRLPAIPELHKPANTWCSNCKPGNGCTIYETRPEVCAEFQCLWLATQDDKRGSMIPALRPDRVKVMMTISNGDLILTEDPGYRGAWRRSPEIVKIVNAVVKSGNEVIIISGDNRTLLSPKRTIQEAINVFVKEDTLT